MNTDKAEEYFGKFFGGNENVKTLTPFAIQEFAESYYQERIKEDLYKFFMWFRKNGELYINESIEEMIQIYVKDKIDTKEA